METESQSGRHLSGKPWDGGHPVRRSGSITHWASAREHHSVLHLGWQTTHDYPRPVRTTLALSPTLSLSSSCAHPAHPILPCAPACGIHTQRSTLVTHSMPTSKLFSLFIKPTPSLRLRGGTNPSCPSTVSSKSRVCHHSKHHQRLLVFKGRQFRLQVSAPQPPPFLLYNSLSSWTLCLR